VIQCCYELVRSYKRMTGALRGLEHILQYEE
jgi:hypothetical protein